MTSLWRREKKEQIDVKQTPEGIGHGHQPEGQVEGEIREGMWR
jgi:hypothetical protein